MVLNSIWPFIMHMFITLLLAVIASRFVRSNLLVVLISLAVALGISFLTRELGNTYMIYWHRFIEVPILRGAFFSDPSEDNNLIGMLFNFVFPAIVAYWVSVVAWRGQKESVG